MVILILIVLGLCFGSFVNALVWRLHEQEHPVKKKKGKTAKKLDVSILRGRSMCVHCHHMLSANDLLPVISWLSLRGKCRYCHKPISWQYPVVELATAALFVASYLWWPYALDSHGITLLALWLIMAVGLMALAVYDIKWFLLPNRLVYPLIGIGTLQALYVLAVADDIVRAATLIGLSVVIAAGLFYVLFQVSKGKWIGGGDVKLGVVLGLALANPWSAFLMIFTASLLGTLYSLPLLLTGRVKRSSHVPFGPFLILATFIVELFGAILIEWYQRQLI